MSAWVESDKPYITFFGTGYIYIQYLGLKIFSYLNISPGSEHCVSISVFFSEIFSMIKSAIVLLGSHSLYR